jgi:hypothetical protein
MVGVPVRVHDLDANDLGIAHLPWPVAIGDIVLLEHSEHRVYDVVPSPPGALNRRARESAPDPSACCRAVAVPPKSELASYLRIEEREREAGGLNEPGRSAVQIHETFPATAGDVLCQCPASVPHGAASFSAYVLTGGPSRPANAPPR